MSRVIPNSYLARHPHNTKQFITIWKFPTDVKRPVEDARLREGQPVYVGGSDDRVG